jgi:hypothetical protein
VISVALRKNLPLDQVLRELDIVHAAFVEAARGLPAHDLVEGQFGRGLLEFTGKHDEEHARDILAWRDREGT